MIDTEQGFLCERHWGPMRPSFLAAEMGSRGGMCSNLKEFPVNVLGGPWTP